MRFAERGSFSRHSMSRPSNSTKQSDPSDTFAQRDAAAEAGMSKRQQTTAVRVANVDDEEFETVVDGDHPPTISQLASRIVAELLSEEN